MAPGHTLYLHPLDETGGAWCVLGAEEAEQPDDKVEPTEPEKEKKHQDKDAELLIAHHFFPLIAPTTASGHQGYQPLCPQCFVGGGSRQNKSKTWGSGLLMRVHRFRQKSLKHRGKMNTRRDETHQFGGDFFKVVGSGSQLSQKGGELVDCGSSCVLFFERILHRENVSFGCIVCVYSFPMMCVTVSNAKVCVFSEKVQSRRIGVIGNMFSGQQGLWKSHVDMRKTEKEQHAARLPIFRNEIWHLFRKS